MVKDLHQPEIPNEDEVVKKNTQKSQLERVRHSQQVDLDLSPIAPTKRQSQTARLRCESPGSYAWPIPWLRQVGGRGETVDGVPTRTRLLPPVPETPR